jgi:hypothetical protein
MAKRLTDTEKWNKHFIRGLTDPYRLLWIYICDVCDYAGLWDVDFAVAKIKASQMVTEQEALVTFNEKIIVIEGGRKWFIPGFIEFHYDGFRQKDGNKKKNNLYGPVMKQLEKYGLVENGQIKGLPSPLEGGNINNNNNNSNEDTITTNNEELLLGASEGLRRGFGGASEEKKIIYTDASLLEIDKCLEVLMIYDWGQERRYLMKENFKMSDEQLIEWGCAFNKMLKTRLLTAKGLRDYAEHFNNWMNLQDRSINPKNIVYGKQGNNNRAGSDVGRRSSGKGIIQPDKDFWGNPRKPVG